MNILVLFITLEPWGVATYLGGSAAMFGLIAFGWLRAGDLRDLKKAPERVAATKLVPVS